MNIEDYIKYIDNELSGAERKELETALALDPETKKEFDAIIAMKNYAKEKSEELKAVEASREIYKEYKQNVPEEKLSSSPGILKFLIPLAVAAMVLLGIFGLGLFEQAAVTNEQLYADFFTPAELSLVVRSEENQELQKNAETSFNNREFSQANEDLSTLNQRFPESQRVKFYKALTDIELDNHEQARLSLSTLSNEENYRSESLYFLALSYIKTNDLQQAIVLLSSIDEGDFRYKDAQLLLSEIK